MKIKKISAYQVDLPLHEGTYKWSGGKSVTVFDSTIVRVETDEGSVGWGEVCPLGPAYLAANVPPTSVAFGAGLDGATRSTWAGCSDCIAASHTVSEFKREDCTTTSQITNKEIAINANNSSTQPSPHSSLFIR